jgi:hyperosmotically inducible protein
VQRRTADTAADARHRTETAASDTWITTKVKSQFIGVDALADSHIDVDTADGVVTLTGSVTSQVARDRAEQIAKQIDGVKSVQNRLTIAPR